MELKVRTIIRKFETRGMCKNKEGKAKTTNIVIKIRILVMHDLRQRTKIDKNDRVPTQTRIKYTHEIGLYITICSVTLFE